MDPTAALSIGRVRAVRTAVGARDQARRLPHGRADRTWTCAAADAVGARLDRQIPGGRRRSFESAGEGCLSRRRAVWHRGGWIAELLADASGERGIAGGATGLLRFRSSTPR